jgi:uncharacterized protein YcnI
MSRPRTLSRAAAAAPLALAGVVLLATPALAPVSVQGPGATQGGFTKISVRVPTERDVPTTKVELAMPTDAPLAFVSVKPHAGWTYTTTKGAPATPVSSDDGPVTEVVTGITWTATAGGIAPGEFDEFDVSVGPLPEAGSITFKALQTYGDGQVVRWIEDAAPGAAEPEHPAPVLRLAAASSADTTSAAPTVSSAPLAAVPAASSTSSDSVSSGKGLATTALVVAVLGALLGLLALLRSGRRASV